jgi:peptidoglycan/LPS O-acetylase OafA/YrhL
MYGNLGTTKSYPQTLLRREMPELGSIRGLAILGVVFYHGLYEGQNLSVYTSFQRSILTLMALGQFGVALFFVLSGFLITGLLLDSRNRSDYYRRFYIRRALRILPAYYAILLILLITHLSSIPFLAISFLYCANLAPLLSISMSYPVLWSLAVEEHFYLVWPAVVHRISLRGLFATAIAIIVAAPILRFFHYSHGLHSGSIWLGFDHFTWNATDGLGCGAALAGVVRRFQLNRRKFIYISLILFAIAGLMVVVGLPYGITTRSKVAGATFLWTLWNFASAGLLTLFLLIGTSRWRMLVRLRILVFFGHISYGFYLIHLLIFWGYDIFTTRLITTLSIWQALWLRFLVAGLLAVIASYLSRRFLEDPFLRLKDKLTT